MNISKKFLSVTGLVATLAISALAASPVHAQGWHDWHHGWHGGHHARRHLDALHQIYARAVAHGHYGVAEEAHLRARAIREHLRARHDDHDWHHWHGGY